MSTHNPQEPAPRILLVEDEPAIQRLVTQLLTGEGHHVTVAPDGTRAIRLLEQHRFDLIVLDVMMPVVDGFGVLKHLRSSTTAGSNKVLMLTALGRDADWLKGLKAGAHDYITKPFDHDELIASVTRLIAMGPQGLLALRERNLERARVLAQLEQVLDP